MAPRERISMTEEEVRGFLATRRLLVLGTLDEDGAPFADVVPYAHDGGSLALALAPGSRSLANIRRDGRVCCIVERFSSYYEIKGVVVRGRAREAGGDGEAVAVRVPLEDVVSFDFAKIRRRA